MTSTSPLSPSMESLGFGSCWPLMIFSINSVFLLPAWGSSNIGLKAPGGTSDMWLARPKGGNRDERKNKCAHTFNHPLWLQSVSTVPIGGELGLVEFKHAPLSLIIHCNCKREKRRSHRTSFAQYRLCRQYRSPIWHPAFQYGWGLKLLESTL